MVNYRQLYLDLLADRNPQKLDALRRSGLLEAVLVAIQEDLTDEELRLTRELAKESLGGRESTAANVTFQESAQAMTTAAVSAREIVRQQMEERAGAA